MTSSSQQPTLGEAASSFLATLPPKEGEASQQAIYGFVRWYGIEHPFAELTPLKVANYAEQQSLLHTNYLNKLEMIKAFLVYGKKQGWNSVNLAAHLKPKKAKAKLSSKAKGKTPAPAAMTQAGYDELKAELAELKGRRVQATEEIRRAAADKDFRENAPLDAAREEKGYLEGRIMELEAIMKSATVLEEASQKKTALKVSVGTSIVLRDEASGEELRYTIVSPREIDPAKGKISNSSPIGKAVLGRAQGETVEITAPVGKLRYTLIQLER